MISDFLLSHAFKKRFLILSQKKSLYKKINKEEEIVRYQLDKLNLIWKYSYENIEFYKYWKDKYNLPEKIHNIDELKCFPVINKDIINKYEDLIFKSLKSNEYTYSGGTSGASTKFPSSSNDKDYCYANSFLGRSWNNYLPFEKTLLFWGHSHLFGSGNKRYFNQIKRTFSDYLINSKRFSSYDLSPINLNKFIDLLNKFKPKVLISYSSSIFKLSKYVSENSIKLFSPEIIILTSETATHHDVLSIENVFQSKILLEYGMAEVGVISYSDSSTFDNKVLWDSFLLQENNSNVRLTTLYPRAFPFFNYDPDDIISDPINYNNSILRFGNIIGKKRDIFRINSKSNGFIEFSVILIDHIIKYYKGIYSTHYQQLKNNKCLICFTAENEIDISDLKIFFNKKIVDEIANVDIKSFSFKQLNDEIKTLAGKTKKIL